MSEQFPSANFSSPGETGQSDPGNLLAEQNLQIDTDIKSALAAKIETVGNIELPSSADYFTNRLRASVEATIDASGFDHTRTSIGPANKKANPGGNSDIAFNVAGMAKEASIVPTIAAEAISEELDNNELIQAARHIGSFVNIELDFTKVGPMVLGEVDALQDQYGHYRDYSPPEVVIIDYSSPNVAKNMTVAHLRSTIIGQSLMKIHEAAGDITFGINHIGDWGTQFGNIIYEYRKELAEKGQAFTDELEANPTATLLRIYRQFTARKDDDPEAVKEAQEIFLKLEQGDPELVTLWDQFRTWSLEAFGPSYDRLGIQFDGIQGESFYEDRMPPTIQDALQRGVLRVNEEGAVVFPAQPVTNPVTGAVNPNVMLDTHGELHDELIVKPSGGTVYLTRDLAALKYRGQELDADRVLYVIGKEQQAHCLKLFEMADQLDYMCIGNALHVSFGHLNIDGRKMSASKGKIALLDTILDESVVAAAKMIETRKNEAGDDSELTTEELETARKVGIAAVIFNDLKQNREKDIEFNPDTARTLEAGSSAYIQYTNSRLTGILAKVGEPAPLTEMPETLHTNERAILVDIARFPEVIKEAARHNSPHRVATYLTELCQTVNLFYHEQPVAKAGSAAEKNFRLNLVKASQQVIKNASSLLHIELPERM